MNFAAAAATTTTTTTTSPSKVPTATTTRKHSYAKHGYKPSTGNMTIVSVMSRQADSRSASRRGSVSSSEESSLGKSVSRQHSVRSVTGERRGRRGQDERRGRTSAEGEGRIVVHTTYEVQSVREDV